MGEIENFEKSGKLHHIEPPQEKIVFPTKADISLEKVPQMAANFDHSSLNHIEPKVSTKIKGIFQN